MKLIIQLLFLCILFYVCLRYDLGIIHTKCISRSILFSLLIGVLYLITLNPSREGVYPGLVMGNSSNYFGTSKSDDMSESEDESSSDESDDNSVSGGDVKKKKGKKGKKKKKKKK